MSNMSSEYRNNHYVPVWYQNKFIPSKRQDKELYYLDLKPGVLLTQGELSTRILIYGDLALNIVLPNPIFIRQFLVL